MPFIKRHLTGEELAKIDYEALGIETRRVPPIEWDWAIDNERQALCTQLISSTYEMREGYYWYLLISQGQPVLFMVDAFGSLKIDGKTYRKAVLNKAAYSKQEALALEVLANEAHQAVSYRGEPLSFEGLQYYSSM